MVNGPSPGPAPAAQARDSNSRLTRSNWRTWPHRKCCAGKFPGWMCALTTSRWRQLSRRYAQHVGVVNEVAPSQRRGHQGQHLVSWVRSPRRVSQVDVAVDDSRRPRCWARVTGRAAQHWPPGGGRRRRYGCGRDGCVLASIGCSLFWGRLCVSKPLSQIHRSTLLPLQDTDPTPSFGGFGLGDSRSILESIALGRSVSIQSPE